MRLDLQITHIRKIDFGAQTGIKDGVLTVNRAELIDLLKKDSRLEEVEIEIALPGEKCRILQVADVIEPRAKIGSAENDDRFAETGTGKTAVLRGAAVVLSDYRQKSDATISAEPHGAIIDMSGPGTEVTPFGKTCNLVMLPLPRAGVKRGDYMSALKTAGLKTAAYLAAAARELTPDEVETYELPALTEMSKGLEGLPKITYIVQILSLQFEPIPGEPVLFGQQATGIVPTILHPNQILDGAVTSPLPGLNVETYHMQNHPTVKALYRHHAKDLCFTGVIATLAPNYVQDFERLANVTASLAKYVIGADGAILTKTAGGAPELAMAYTAQRCEELGVKTTIAMLHMGADVKDFKHGALTIFSMPEVDAIVSMGTPYMGVTMPAVERIIGRPGFAPDAPPIDGQIFYTLGHIKGAMCQMGSSNLKAVRY